MARYQVQNISGTRFHVPPPVGLTLAAGATAVVEAASLDTEQITDLIDDDKIVVTPLVSLTPGGDNVATASFAAGGGPQTQLGASTAGITIADAEVMTFTHGLGIRPVKVLVTDDTTGGLAAATVTVGGTADTVTVTNGSGGPLDLLVEIHFEAGAKVGLAAVIPATDSRIAVA